MARTARVDAGGEFYHVLNRANGRLKIFEADKDYQLFEHLLTEAKELTDMRILAYVVMPNHWHLVLNPQKDGDLALFLHHLTNAHTRKVHALTNTNGSGHLYQGRYKSFLIGQDGYLLTAVKYTERNPVRADLVPRCEDWRWSSAWRRAHGTNAQRTLLAELPETFPRDHVQWINAAEDAGALELIRASVNKGAPYGKSLWVEEMVTRFSLESTQHGVGRPKKQ